MSDGSVVRSNERIKAVAGMLFQFGSALFAAGVVKIYLDRALSLEPSLWIFLAGVIIWIAWLWLGLLESED